MSEDPKAPRDHEPARPGPKSLLALAGVGGLLVVLATLAGYLLLVRSGDEPTIAAAVGSGEQGVDHNGGVVDSSDDERLDHAAGGLDGADLAAAADVAEPAGFGDPAAVELPAIDDAVGSWLDADGHQVVSFIQSVVRLWAEGSGACDEVVSSLAEIGEPAEVELVALSAPDPVVADVLGGLYRTVARALLACGGDSDGEEFEMRRAELAWQWSLAARVIDASGDA